MPTVTIAMATYNGAKYLQGQLDSLAAQTRRPDEVVILDDASTDDTVPIAEAFAQTAGFPVRIFRNDSNIGVDQNFSRALGLAESVIVFVCDQDDVWLPGKLARMIDALTDSGRPAVMCDAIVMGAGPRFDGRTGADIDAEAAYPNPPPPKTGGGACCAFTREYLQAVLPVPAGAIYDVWLNEIAIALDLRTVIGDALQYWRKHDSNTSSFLSAVKPRAVPADPLRDWPSEIEQHDAKLDRINALARLFPKAGARASRAIDEIKRKREALERRLLVVKRPRLARAAPILGLLLSGDYARFNGIRSAVGDLLR